MRVMLDTNVLISLFLFRGMKLEDMLIKICQQHTLVLSSIILKELYEVVERKFPGKSEYLDIFLDKVFYEFVNTPEYNPNNNFFSIRDNQDEEVLFSAIAANVDVFITGDKDFLEVGINKPEILTPAAFLEKY